MLTKKVVCLLKNLSLSNFIFLLFYKEQILKHEIWITCIKRKTWQKDKGTSNETYEESANNTDKSQNTVWSKDTYKKSLLLNLQHAI